MELESVRESIKMVAEKEGISEERVIFEIEAAMAEARKSVYADGDKRKIAMWEAVPCVGETPTAAEFVAFMCDVVEMIMECQEA